MTAPRMGVFGDVSKVGQRDAFHVPVVLVTCDSVVFPGDRAVFDGPNKIRPKTTMEKCQAIVDPWLDRAIPDGTPFYVMVSPDLVGDLVHHFEIDGIPSAVDLAVKKAVEEAEREFDEDYPCRDCY